MSLSATALEAVCCPIHYSIVFKPDPGSDPVKRPGSGFSGFAQVNPGRVYVVKNKKWKREAIMKG
jgi:hypothetical protein